MISVLSLPAEVNFASSLPADCTFVVGYSGGSADCVPDLAARTLRQTFITGTQMILETEEFFVTPLCAITTSQYTIRGYTSDMLNLAWEDDIGTVTVTAGSITINTKS